MNGNDIMKAMNGINEEYLSDSEITVKKSRKPAKSIFRIAVGIAAAAAFAIPVGAYAYNTFIHKDKVSIYYTQDGTQKLEESGLANGFTTENGKIRITLDTSMCDGHFTSGVYTITALTDDAKEHLATSYLKLVYADTGEGINPIGGATEGWASDAETDADVSKIFTFPIRNAYIDGSRPLRLEFWEDTPNGEKDEYGGTIVTEDDTYYGGLYFELETKPNIPCKELRSTDGDTLTLSLYGVSQLDKDWKYPEDDHEQRTDIKSFNLILKNGDIVNMANTESVFHEWSGELGGGNFYYHFGDVIDIDNASGVEINGVEYMAE